jgi:hypothetical protein
VFTTPAALPAPPLYQALQLTRRRKWMADDAGFSTISISSRRDPYGQEREVESLLVRPPSASDRVKAFLRYPPLSIFAVHFIFFHLPNLFTYLFINS